MAQELRFDILGATLHRIRRQVCFETFWLVFLQGELAILEIYAENLLIYENIED